MCYLILSLAIALKRGDRVHYAAVIDSLEHFRVLVEMHTLLAEALLEPQPAA
jgi:hypothetical protein